MRLIGTTGRIQRLCEMATRLQACIEVLVDPAPVGPMDAEVGEVGFHSWALRAPVGEGLIGELAVARGDALTLA